MRGFKGATMNIARFILVCLGAMFVLFPSSIPEVYGSQETLGQLLQEIKQEILEKNQELKKAFAEADMVRAEVRKRHPNDIRSLSYDPIKLIKSDIAALEKRLGDLKDVKLIVLSIVNLPPALVQGRLQQFNKELAPFFSVDEKGDFHLGSGLSWLSLAGVPKVIQAKDVKKMLDGGIAQAQKALINPRNQLAILEKEQLLLDEVSQLERKKREMETALKLERAQLEREKDRGEIVKLVLNCAKNEIFEDDSTTCSATATYKNGFSTNIYEGVQWDPSRFVDQNGQIKGEEVKKLVGNLPREGYEIKVKFSYGGQIWGPVSVTVLPKETSAAIPPPKPVQQQQQQQQPLQMTTVPDVVGLEKQTAEYDIAAANLKVRNVRTQRDHQRAGVVIDQDPRPGKSVQVGSPVDLVVSSGTPATVRTLYVDPASKTIEMTEKPKLRALLWYTDGREEDVTDKATWAGADSTGIFTPTKPGKFQITASFSGFSASSTITVREPLPPQWSSRMSHADQIGARGEPAPPSHYTWYVMCDKKNGEVVYGEYPDVIPYHVMFGPCEGPNTALWWIEGNCPRWRCTAEGACAKEPAYVSGGKWAVVCDRKSGDVGLTEYPNVVNQWILAEHFFGEPDARMWANKNCPTWRCNQDGKCGDAPRKGGKWAVVCDKNTGSVALTEYPNIVSQWILGENFFGEIDARMWANKNCPTWRCNREGKCQPGSQPIEGAGGRSLELPPDFSNIGSRFADREQRRNREAADRSAADASRYGTGLTTSPQVTTNDQTTPTSGGTTTTTTPGVTSLATPSPKTSTTVTGTTKTPSTTPTTDQRKWIAWHGCGDKPGWWCDVHLEYTTENDLRRRNKALIIMGVYQSEKEALQGTCAKFGNIRMGGEFAHGALTTIGGSIYCVGELVYWSGQEKRYKCREPKQ